MPLTEKGREIKSAMLKEYGPEKGERVFYASKNAGRITGVDMKDAISGMDAINKHFKIGHETNDYSRTSSKPGGNHEFIFDPANNKVVPVRKWSGYSPAKAGEK